METLHKANIIIHIVSGSVALILGLIALIVNKWKPLHRRIGRLFLWFITLVVFTGFLGVFLFGRNAFLVVITALSAYNAFSGYRILQTKSNKPMAFDIIAGLLTTSTVVYFLYYLKSIGMIWDPVVIYSTVGATLLVVTYDFLRYLIPKSKYKTLWLYEHIYKMTGAFTALLAAFSGTVFKHYQPYSQILPSALGLLVTVGFMRYIYKSNKSKSIRHETH
jgi:hypothetical protein